MAEQRASDADREHAAERLRQAGGDGRLDFDELDERVQTAYQARTRPELDRLLVDLGEAHELTRPTATGSGLTVRPGGGGSAWVVALMGGATRTGRWRVAEHCRVLNVMGGSEIDLTEAELAAEEVTITVISLMGGGDVYVPEGLRVEVTDVGILGGNDVEQGTPGSERHDGPLVRLRLISIMGGTTVRRGSRAERKARRRARQDERRELRGDRRRER